MAMPSISGGSTRIRSALSAVSDSVAFGLCFIVTFTHCVAGLFTHTHIFIYTYIHAYRLNSCCNKSSCSKTKVCSQCHSVSVSVSVSVSFILSLSFCVCPSLSHRCCLPLTDEVGLVLVGTEDTKNDLADTDGGYESITMLSPIKRVCVPQLQQLGTISPSKTQGDVLDGIVVALTMLHNHSVRYFPCTCAHEAAFNLPSRVAPVQQSSKGFTHRMFVITDAASPISDQEQVDTITNYFKQFDCTLDFMCVSLSPFVRVPVPCFISSPPLPRSGIEFDDNSAGTGAGAGAGASVAFAAGKSKQKMDNEKLLATMAKAVDGNVLPVESAVEVMSRVRSRSVTSQSKFRGELNVGGVVSLPCWTFGKVDAQKPPSLKKLSTVPDGDPVPVRRGMVHR